MIPQRLGVLGVGVSVSPSNRLGFPGTQPRPAAPQGALVTEPLIGLREPFLPLRASKGFSGWVSGTSDEKQVFVFY